MPRDAYEGNYREQRTLAEYEGEWVNLRCLHAHCSRTGRLRKATLVERYGDQIGLVTLINILAPKDCPHNVKDAAGHRHCGACYADLT